jgi:hypothetical protein
LHLMVEWAIKTFLRKIWQFQNNVLLLARFYK